MDKLILIGAIILVVIGGYFLINPANSSNNSPSTTGNNVLCDSVPAANAVVGDNFCIGKKSFWGGLGYTCSVQVQNLESQPADFSVVFNCFTVENPNPVQKVSSKEALSGGEVGTFTIKFDTDGREWRCDVLSVVASKVNSCVKT